MTFHPRNAVTIFVSLTCVFFVSYPIVYIQAAGAEPNPDKKGDECKKKADEAKKRCDASKQQDTKACQDSKKEMYKDAVKIDAKSQSSTQVGSGECVPKEGCQKAKRSHTIDVAGGGSKQCDKCMDEPGAGNKAVEACMKEGKDDKKKEDEKKPEEKKDDKKDDKKGDEKKGDEKGGGDKGGEPPKMEPPQKEEPKKEEPQQAQPCVPGSQGSTTDASGNTSQNPCGGQTEIKAAQKTLAQKIADGTQLRRLAGQSQEDIDAWVKSLTGTQYANLSTLTVL